MNPLTFMKALNDIDDVYLEEVKPQRQSYVLPMMKRRFIMTMASILLVAAAIGYRRLLPPVIQGNPNITCQSLQEAKKLTGFSLHIPDDPQSYATKIITVINKKIIDVTYYDHSDHEILCIRKGKNAKDISGDYHTYAYQKTISRNGYELTVKGSKTHCYLAEWTRDGYQYAVHSSEGLTQEELITLVDEIN